MHQPPNLLMVHPDPGMKEPHMYPHDTFGITPKVVGISDQHKIELVLRFFVTPCCRTWGL